MDRCYPLLFLAATMATLSFFTGLLYKRWRTLNYLVLLCGSGITGFMALLFFLISIADADPSFMRVSYLVLSNLMFLIMHAALMHYFRKDDIRKMYAHFGAAGGVLIGGFIYYASTAAGFLIEFLSVAIVILSFRMNIPKRPYLLTAYVLFVIGHLLMIIDFILSKPLFVGQVFHVASLLAMQLMFFDRVVDMLEAVSYTAVTDGLTGIFTKSYFLKNVREAVRDGNAFALIFSDIDNFKRLNDTQGHQMGDEILKLVAKTMRDVIDGIGIAGRYGGEEIVALITDPLVDPGVVAEDFRSRVEESSTAVYPVTVSVGYTIYEAGISIDEFVNQADEAMYKAKKRGKNRVVSYQIY